MHGRPRQPPRAMTPEELAKIEKYNHYKKMALAGNKKRVYTDATYKLTSSLLPLNPDFYTVFNYRKEILLHMFKTQPESRQSLLEKEMVLMEEALKTQPKSYYAWYHRVWCIDQGFNDFLKELELCSQFLKYDSRNFHCWNYRRTVATLAIQQGLTTLQSEFDFTTEKINESFSNYSAWHYRSVLLPLLAAQLVQNVPFDKMSQTPSDMVSPGDVACSGSSEVDALLTQDLNLCASAFAVSSSDQSAWLYHRWLLGLILSLHASASKSNIEKEGVVSSLLPYIPKLHAQMTAYDRKTGEHSLESDQAPTAHTILSSLADAFTDRFLTLHPDSCLAGDASVHSDGDLEERRTNTLFLQNKLDVVNAQVDLLTNRILAMEPDSKWILTSLAVLQVAAHQLRKHQASPTEETETKYDFSQQIQKLIQLDPLRTHYYEYILSKLQD